MRPQPAPTPPPARTFHRALILSLGLTGLALGCATAEPEADPPERQVARAECEPHRFVLREGICTPCSAAGRWEPGVILEETECLAQRCDPYAGAIWRLRDGAPCGDGGRCEAGACAPPPPPTTEPVPDLPTPPADPAPASEDPAPEDPAPPAPAPEDPAPEDPAPEDPAPEDPAPEDPAPEDPAPEDPAPEDPAPEDPAPDDPAPEDPAPEDPAPPACVHGACAVRLRPGDDRVLEVLAAAYRTVDGQPLTELVAQGQACAVAWAIGEDWHHREVPVADADGDGWVSFALPPLRAHLAPYPGCWRCQAGLPVRIGLRRCHPDLIAPDHYLALGGGADDRAGDFYFRGLDDTCAESITLAVAAVDGRVIPAGAAARQACP